MSNCSEGNTHTFSQILQMKEMPEAAKSRLRFLSFGPDAGSMWRWTYHDGSTFAVLCYNTDETEKAAPYNIIAWACLTKQEEPLPVLGVYVQAAYRGCGLATRLIRRLLVGVQLPSRSRVYAVSANWPKYPELLAQHGLLHEEWE